MPRSRWTRSPKGFGKQARDDMTVMLTSLAEQAARGVIYRSPKDTSRFLTNNNFSVNGADNSFDESARDRSRNDTLANARIAIAKLKAGDSFEIVNTTPYGEVLENGGSQQAPQGIFAITMNNLVESSR